jgi:HK97 family phage portal protein
VAKRDHKTAKGSAKLFDAQPQYSISDPALAEFLGMAGVWGAEITEQQALTLTAVYRAQSLISSTIAGLPLKVYAGPSAAATPSEFAAATASMGLRHQIPHFLSESPCGPYDLSKFSWMETIVLHLLNHAEAYLKTVTNEAGELIGLWPIHPLAVSRVHWDGADKTFHVMLSDGAGVDYASGEVYQVLGMSMDGLRGISPLSLFRQSLQTSKAGELAANRAFTSGSLISGLVTTEEDVDGEEAKVIKESLRSKMAGAEHAGDIAFVNRSLKFTPWAMTNADAEFLASRAFQVEEVARMYGVPPHLLMATEKQTSWGTGIAEQNVGLSRYTLMGWTSRIESVLSQVLPPGVFAEFDYTGLLQGSPAEEINLLIAQVTAGILTKDEARAIRNLPPLTPEQKAELAPPAPVAPPNDNMGAQMK